MNAKLFTPGNLLVIAIIILAGQFAISGVKQYLSSKSTDDSGGA